MQAFYVLIYVHTSNLQLQLLPVQVSASDWDLECVGPCMACYSSYGVHVPGACPGHCTAVWGRHDCAHYPSPYRDSCMHAMQDLILIACTQTRFLANLYECPVYFNQHWPMRSMRTPVASMSIPCFLEMGKESIKLIKRVVYSGSLIFTQVLYIHTYMHKHKHTHYTTQLYPVYVHISQTILQMHTL